MITASTGRLVAAASLVVLLHSPARAADPPGVLWETTSQMAMAGMPMQMPAQTQRLVDEAIARGPLVIVGRGAWSMLAARSDALHVFCHAPRGALISRSMTRDKLNEQEATRLVDETNAHREQWVRRHWNRDWRDPANYDLSVNTGSLGIAGASDIIISAAQMKFGIAQPKAVV